MKEEGKDNQTNITASFEEKNEKGKCSNKWKESCKEGTLFLEFIILYPE